MAIPVILSGETAKPIRLALADGYDYAGCSLHVDFCGTRSTFEDLVAGGSLELCFTAEQTATFPLGTSKAMLSLENAAGEIRFMPWAKIKVTDSPADLYDAQITIDPATLDVDELPARFTDEMERDRINAIIRWLKGAVALFAVCALPAYGAGVTVQSAPKGAIYNDEPVVTNIVFDASGLASEEYVDSVAQSAAKKDFVAEPFDPTKDYAEGDVVQIDGTFYVFTSVWRHQWSGSPIEEECVEELRNVGGVTKYQNAQEFLQLGFGGTNAPSYKRINTSHDGEQNTYFTFQPDGFTIDGSYGQVMRLNNNEFQITTNNWQSYWSIRFSDILTRDTVLPMSSDYFRPEYATSPTSPYYVYNYLLNNYLTKANIEYDYLTKTEAGNTYITESAADGKYSTPAGVASALLTALGDFEPQYIYNDYGNYRLDVDGNVQRQTHSGNIDFTNATSGVVLQYNSPNEWRATGTQLGDITVTRANGVVVCSQYPIMRYVESYPDTTVWQFPPPLGTFRAVLNDSGTGTLSWNNYDALAKSSEVDEQINAATNSLGQAITAVEAKTPNNITRTGTDATLVHADGGSTTNLIYIRQASSSLAGLMTAADKSAFDTMKTTVSNHETAIHTVTNDNAQTRQIVATWENFLDGSNVVFSITNYISGAYSLDAAKLRILELRDGEYQEVYNSRDEILLHIDDFSNRYVRVALDAIVDEVAERLASKADCAWGKYTSAGGEAPSNTVYMTAPNTVFAGGLEYERVAVGEGTICVLTTRGAPVWTQGDEGTFKFQDDGGTNYFGFAKTDSYTIGANPDGITVQGGMVTLNYNITMSGRLCVWYKSSLSSGAWEQLNLPDGSSVAGASYAVTWEANPDPGTQVCYLNVGNQPQGFFRATVEVAGEAKFMTNMPADLSGGVICTNTAKEVDGVIKPSFNGSSVIWTWSVN